MPRPDDGRHVRVGRQRSTSSPELPPGVVPGQWATIARPMAYPYAAFSPVGRFFDAEFAAAYVGGCFRDGRVPDLSTQAQDAVGLSGRDTNNTPTNGIYPGLACRGLTPPSSSRKVQAEA